jgi:hypothetical protein
VLVDIIMLLLFLDFYYGCQYTPSGFGGYIHRLGFGGIGLSCRNSPLKDLPV